MKPVIHSSVVLIAVMHMLVFCMSAEAISEIMEKENEELEGRGA